MSDGMIKGGRKLLDLAYAMLRDGDTYGGMALLHESLHELRTESEPTHWRRFCSEVCHRHPVKDLIHEDPLTRHCFDKPRGYAGDAVLLDYIYGVRPLPLDTSPRGRQVHSIAFDQPNGRSVRERRVILASRLSQVILSNPSAHLFSVACGHLRELDFVSAPLDLTTISALDSDKESLALISTLRNDVKSINNSIRAILSQKLVLRDQDFIYAAGLYDYLSDAVARRLTALLFSMLKPGGSLLVANFQEGRFGAAYMEAFMDWWLLYRDKDCVESFTSEIQQDQIREMCLSPDSINQVLYLQVYKR